MNENLSAPSGVWTVIKKIFALPLLWIAAAALLIVGQSVGSFTYLIFDLFPALEESDAWMTGASYVYFIGIWVVVLLVLAIIPKNRPILGALGNKVRGNTWRIYALGLARTHCALPPPCSMATFICALTRSAPCRSC